MLHKAKHRLPWSPAISKTDRRIEVVQRSSSCNAAHCAYAYKRRDSNGMHQEADKK